MFLNGGEREISGGGGYDIVDTVCQTHVYSSNIYIYFSLTRIRKKQNIKSSMRYTHSLDNTSTRNNSRQTIIYASIHQDSDRKGVEFPGVLTF